MAERPLPRRGFFRMGFLKAAKAAADTMSEFGKQFGHIAERSVPEKKEYFSRPPGAVADPEFGKLCTKCHDCVAACPAWSIRKAAEEEPGTGYPLVEPNVTSCALCEDPVPCIVACQTGALVMTPRASIRLGLVRLERSLCVVPLGQACDFCVTYCPVSDEAIRMSEEGPVISESACTGCGMCVVMCPEDALRVGAVEGAW